MSTYGLGIQCWAKPDTALVLGLTVKGGGGEGWTLNQTIFPVPPKKVNWGKCYEGKKKPSMRIWSKGEGVVWAGTNPPSGPGAEGSSGVSSEVCGETTFQRERESLWPGPWCQRAWQLQEMGGSEVRVAVRREQRREWYGTRLKGGQGPENIQGFADRLKDSRPKSSGKPWKGSDQANQT